MYTINAAVRKEARKLLKDNNVKGFFELFFNSVDECSIGRYDEKGYQLETWTDGGVDMIPCFDSKTILKDFKDYVINFDVDEEIDIHRQDNLYRANFTLRESLNDFEAYVKWLKKIISIIEKFEAK